jgi:hypothetical protein
MCKSLSKIKSPHSKQEWIVLSQQPIITKVKWDENKFTKLFDYASKRKLIFIFPESIQYYAPLLKKLEKDRRVRQLFNVDLSHTTIPV